MGSVQSPIGGEPRDPYEGYRVEQVERERQAKEKQKEEFPEEDSPEKKSIIFAYVLMLLHRLFELFHGMPEKGISAESEKGIRTHLLRLFAFFETMKKEDRSQDIDFLNALSKTWENILEDALLFKKSSILAKEFRKLVDDIQHYPPKQSHTLGYYLSEYAGQKWLPFPYMELIQKIHQEYLRLRTQSALESWTKSIEQLLILMKSD